MEKDPQRYTELPHTQYCLTDRDENAVDICHKYFHAYSDCHIPLFYLLQVFRTDLITAMKLHDSYQLNPEDYYELADPWRQEWEKGVQVPVSPDSIPQCTVRYEAFFFFFYLSDYSYLMVALDLFPFSFFLQHCS